MTFGERLRQARKDAGHTQEGLARELGVSLSNVRNWELRGTMPRSETVSEIAGTLDVSVSWLLTGKDDPYEGITLMTFIEMMDSAEAIINDLLYRRDNLGEEVERRLAFYRKQRDAARELLGLKEQAEGTDQADREATELHREVDALSDDAPGERDPPSDEGEPQSDQAG